MVKDLLIKDLTKAIKSLGYESSDIVLSISEKGEFGDYTTNSPLQLAKQNLDKSYQSPLEIAKTIVEKLGHPLYLERIDIAGPGFINFFIKPSAWHEGLKEILTKKEKFGDSTFGKGKKAQVEFISANPTGPLTLGNGRGGFTGDSIANVLEKVSYEVEREYYVNDTGNQVNDALEKSVTGSEHGPYKGEHIEQLVKRLNKEKGEGTLSAGQKAARIILEEMIKKTLEKMKINHGKGFDLFFHESSLYEADKNPLRQEVLSILQSKGLIYDQDDAIFFKSTQFGDDKDRVIFKKDGNPTYFFSDILHKSYIMGAKFDRLILLLGADHHGYQARLQAALEAFGYKDKLTIIIVQLVGLISGGKELRMSKRKGIYVTLDQLFELLEGDVDAARFYFVSRAPNTHLDFDIDLVKEQSNKNPVYYVKYAHARMSSLLVKAKEAKLEPELGVLEERDEANLVRLLYQFPELIETLAQNLEVHKLTEYAINLADLFHKFYESCPVLMAPKDQTKRHRLALVQASKIVLANTLDLIGVEAPERM